MEGSQQTITSKQLVRMLKDASRGSKGKGSGEMKFCFLIGAGASISSGIPSGAKLAWDWLQQIKEDCDGEDFEDWKIEIKMPDQHIEERVGEFYPEIYEKRFGHAPETGYDYIRGLMEGREPSLGYLILANIMVREKHNVVITTNFDNLLEDAIRTYTKEKPFIAGHEALADYVPKRSDRPIILKLHRDLFLQPFSDQLNTDILQAAWESILGKFLSDYHLIVLGYGGNDGSLMNYLLKLKNRKPIYWCVRNTDKATSKSLWNTLSPKAKRLLKNDGYLVPIDDFDRFMYDCYAALGYKFLEGIEKIEKPKSIHEILKPNYARIESIQTQLRQLSQTEEELSKESFQSIKSFLPDSWMWILKANQEKDIDKKDKIYQEGIAKYPQDADLLGDYANFLCDIRHAYDQAESYYKKALEADPNHANNLGNYALFLQDIRHAYDQAEGYYKRALEADPKNANALGNYASFLHTIRHAYDQAEAYYKQALEADPNHANTLGNYANFLCNIRHAYDQAEVYYKQALEADPKNANALGNYASFLHTIRHAYDQAEAYYKQALEVDPNHANTFGNYANFLCNIRHAYDQAEVYYRRALEADPKNAVTLGNYAVFLNDIRHDYDQAEAYYKRALEADPNHANNLGNYAHFLITCRGDFKRADSLIQQAFENADNDEETKPLQAELWFYRYAHYYEEWEAEAEKELAALLNAGAKSIGWDLAPDIELARKNRHPHIEQVEAFAKALTEKA
ncbi:SIR2 family protein [Porphyromonas gingivalis]|uniref:tetratricopeptide repeat protein n=1 Tax=Porphyromonas gingivalis TaxID=837 RepID=UPI000BE70BE9|nr:tetratricopeptide repeat protein [Porphyromonas gingivalis]ATS05747.1 SIR2 family protein [Porphyromonas gingivalis]PDP57680.1 SIR2 family protein [Porphyromonas gingivalis]